MGAELAVADVDERTRRLITSLLGRKTPRQIADEAGVTPDVVLRVKQDLVDGIDALTVDEHVAVAVSLLHEVARKALAEFDKSDDARSKAPLLQSVTGAVKTQVQVLEKWRTKNESAVATLNAKRQSELVTLMQTTVDRGVEEIARDYDLDKQTLFDVFNRHLIEAAMEMDARNGPDDG